MKKKGLQQHNFTVYLTEQTERLWLLVSGAYINAKVNRKRNTLLYNHGLGTDVQCSGCLMGHMATPFSFWLYLFTSTSPFTRLILSLCVCVCLSHGHSMHVAGRDNSLEQVYSVHLVKPRDPALMVKPVWNIYPVNYHNPPSLLSLFQNTRLFKEYELAVSSDGQVQLKFASEPSLTLNSPKRTVTF